VFVTFSRYSKIWARSYITQIAIAEGLVYARNGFADDSGIAMRTSRNTVYRNGIEAPNGVIHTGAVTMGNSEAAISFDAEENFHGAIDEIRIYNRALSDFEVLEFYQEHICDCTQEILDKRKRYDPSANKALSG